MKILVVEGEKSLREIIRTSLEKERFIVETDSDTNSALIKLEEYDYDCSVLDIMMPGGVGFDILSEIKKQGKKENVIIVSAKDAWEDKVKGLDLGADDYLAKPFHLAELTARIRSIIRRNNNNGDMSITFNNVKLNPDNFTVSVNGQSLPLLRKEYDILYYFISRPERLVNKSTLAEAVWGDHIDGVDNFDFIYAQMKNLRKKLKESGAGIEIKSVYGFGYKLVEL